MDGIDLNIKFAEKPNSLQYCGPNCANSDFAIYLENENNLEEVKKTLLKFEALPIYLDAIAKKNNLDIFDYKVAEAYWIGNNLLDNFNKQDMKNIIDKLVLRGMLKSEGERLKSVLIDGFVPHHLFHVFFVGIGKTSGKIEPLFKFKEQCRPSIGRVKKVLEDKLIILRTPLIMKDDRYFLGRPEEKEVSYIKKFIGEIKIEDYVAVHWGDAVFKLNQKQVNNLEKYTTDFFSKFKE